MIARTFLFLLAFMPFGVPGYAEITNPLKAIWGKPTPPKPPTIRVLIVHDKPTIQLEVVGKYVINDPNSGSLISNRYLGKNKPVETISEGLKWGEEFPGYHQLELVPTEATTKFLVNGVEYPGKLTVYDIGGSISVTNEVLIEDYLRATLENKYKGNFLNEVLAALVIGERTNAFYQAQNPKTKFWAVDGAVVGYNGLNDSNLNSPLQKTIRNTKNMVLSKTGAYEGIITPFALRWDMSNKGTSLITVAEAETMAQNGDHAANILDKAFPHTSIQIIDVKKR